MANVHQDFSYGSQIYVFKVEINCCLDCPRKLKNCLLDLNGIESVQVDETQNMVTVKGIIDSRKIINKLKKMGKIAEPVHERKETNPYGYRVELNDEDEDEDEDEGEEKEKDSFNDSFRRKESSFRHKDSSFRHKNTRYRPNDSSFRARDNNKGSSHAPEKYDNSESSNAFSAKEIPDHVCRDKYCTIHKRDISMPNMINYGASYPASFRGGLNYNYPAINSYPHMYGPPPPPPPPPQYGSQYYGQGMVPPVAGYHATPRQMPRPRADGYSDYFSDGYSNGCNVM